MRERAGRGLAESDNIVLVEGELNAVETYRQVFAERFDVVYHLAALSGQKWGADETNITG